MHRCIGSRYSYGLVPHALTGADGPSTPTLTIQATLYLMLCAKAKEFQRSSTGQTRIRHSEPSHIPQLISELRALSISGTPIVHLLRLSVVGETIGAVIPLQKEDLFVGRNQAIHPKGVETVARLFFNGKRNPR